MNIPALELNLKAEDLFLSRAELLQRLVEETSIKSWLFHPDQRSAETDWIKVRRRRIVADARTCTANHDVDSAASRPQLRRQGNSDWRRDNAWAEWFFRKHGRYPNIDETLTFERMKRKR
jgi:hypothetical protein